MSLLIVTNFTDPLLLFNEIIGVIKGSETALATDSGYLDRSTYEQLSSRVYPMFADRRGLVYDLFLRYLRYRPKGAWDVADRFVLLSEHSRRIQLKEFARNSGAMN